jgi:hypothetical protein
VVEQLSAIARGLGQFDDEGGLASMLASLVAASRELLVSPISKAMRYSSMKPVASLLDCEIWKPYIQPGLSIISQQTITAKFCRRFCLLFAIPAFGKGS